jgi:predicted nucleic acid-binding protein
VTASSPGPVFVDTNVLVYAHDRSETLRQPVAQALVAELWRNRSGALSTQVLQEFYVVATRKYDPPMSRRETRQLVDAYSHWQLIQVDVALILAASQLEERHTLSFWDALIVEAARRAGANRLVTEDLQSGRRLAGVLIHNPFTRPGPT